jgi:hypothetical protein
MVGALPRAVRKGAAFPHGKRRNWNQSCRDHLLWSEAERRLALHRAQRLCEETSVVARHWSPEGSAVALHPYCAPR